MKKHSKDHIISVGEQLFRTRGYFNTGTEELLQIADYPRSSFYHHFKTKENFAIEVLERYGNTSRDFYQSVLLNKQFGSPLHRLQKFTELLTKNAEWSHFSSECLIQKFSVECAGFNETLKESTGFQLNKLLSVLKECIAEGQSSNELRIDLPPMKMAEFLLAQIYGSFILARLENSSELMSQSLKMALETLRSKN
jgi:TetR/AcrR family transcriptional repressor of nem operon